MTNVFINPYLGVDKQEVGRRVTFSVHKDDKMLLRMVRPEMGTETIVCSILYKKFCDALKERGIVDMTRSNDLELFAANLELIWKTKTSKAHSKA